METNQGSQAELSHFLSGLHRVDWVLSWWILRTLGEAGKLLALRRSWGNETWPSTPFPEFSSNITRASSAKLSRATEGGGVFGCNWIPFWLRQKMIMMGCWAVWERSHASDFCPWKRNKVVSRGGYHEPFSEWPARLSFSYLLLWNTKF